GHIDNRREHAVRFLFIFDRQDHRPALHHKQYKWKLVVFEIGLYLFVKHFGIFFIGIHPVRRGLYAKHCFGSLLGRARVVGFIVIIAGLKVKLGPGFTVDGIRRQAEVDDLPAVLVFAVNKPQQVLVGRLFWQIVCKVLFEGGIRIFKPVTIDERAGSEYRVAVGVFVDDLIFIQQLIRVLL